MSAQVEAVRKLHRPWRIYDVCGHEHTEEDVDAGRARHVWEVGYTCEDGLMYVVCRECCSEGEDGEYQSETCATEHTHGEGIPICNTIAALEAAADAAEATS